MKLTNCKHGWIFPIDPIRPPLYLRLFFMKKFIVEFALLDKECYICTV